VRSGHRGDPSRVPWSVLMKITRWPPYVTKPRGSPAKDPYATSGDAAQTSDRRRLWHDFWHDGSRSPSSRSAHGDVCCALGAGRAPGERSGVLVMRRSRVRLLRTLRRSTESVISTLRALG
jgi:hypothetical protein